MVGRARRALERVSDQYRVTRDTDGKVADIALEAGFQFHPVFYRWFGKLTSQSPKEYRRMPHSPQ